jgi:hypothetical protein
MAAIAPMPMMPLMAMEREVLLERMPLLVDVAYPGWSGSPARLQDLMVFRNLIRLTVGD